MDNSSQSIKPIFCIEQECYLYEIGYVGHSSLFCSFARKCPFRFLFYRDISRFQREIEQLLREKGRKFTIEHIFATFPYCGLSEKWRDMVDSLEFGEFGFEKRGSLSEKQFRLLRNLYYGARSRTTYLE